ncbi:trypco2 family protein [Azospirillum argentinense]
MGSLKNQITGICILASSLAGCATSPPVATEVIPLHLVVDRVKGELATYAVLASKPEERVEGYACGLPQTERKLDMDFSAVSLVLNTVVANSGGLKAEAGVIPLGTVTGSAGIGGSLTDTKSQKITIALTPLKPSGPIETTESRPLGIADALLAVRRELLKTNLSQPCMQPDSLEIQVVFGVTKNVSAKFGVNLIVVSIGSDVSSSRTDTHAVNLTAKLIGTPTFM